MLAARPDHPDALHLLGVEGTAARLRHETATELGSLRRGATALHGYASPGAAVETPFPRLDQRR